MLLRGSLLAVALHVARVGGITVEGGQTHEDSDIDNDEFLWEKLPGRCCFYGARAVCAATRHATRAHTRSRSPALTRRRCARP